MSSLLLSITYSPKASHQNYFTLKDMAKGFLAILAVASIIGIIPLVYFYNKKDDDNKSNAENPLQGRVSFSDQVSLEEQDMINARDELYNSHSFQKPTYFENQNRTLTKQTAYIPSIKNHKAEPLQFEDEGEQLYVQPNVAAAGFQINPHFQLFD